MTIKGKVRFEVFKRDNFTCQYCGRKAPEVRLTIDHCEAQSSGGSDEIENLKTCCDDCNSGKGSTSLEASDLSNFTVVSKDQIKNLHYPRVSFRVSNETLSNLKEVKGDKSWNLFFVEMIKLYEKFGRSDK